MSYTAHLSKDKKLREVLAESDPLELKPRKNIPLRLCASIMSQQLSTKVAAVLLKRFLEIYGGKEPTLEQIVETPFERLRGIGLSGAKAQYVLNVANFCTEQKITDKSFKKLRDEEVIELLIQIKGVGRWTVEMLLMFTLAREDVFAIDDFGIRSAMKSLYQLDDSNKREFTDTILRLSQKWSPYRTYACLHLWNWKDTKPAVPKP